ncbi:MAG: glycoside hydrolase family 15 protein [Candidatus Peribacteraceae bacterium]|nr:glycoside hydrolase family 15 protein [Candidatus Peribacteraceae bacterium]
MPRSLVIGNGSMFAAFDEHLEMRDLYFPYVGMEDHSQELDRHRVGIWVKGRGFKWLSDPSWKITPRYKPETMVGNSLLRNESLGIKIVAEDLVHPVHNILLRRFHIKNLEGDEKEVRMFFNHDLHIYGDKQKDTAFYEPYTNTVIHYRQTRYFLVGGETNKPTECVAARNGGRYGSALEHMEERSSCGISSYTVGKSEYQGLEGTWRDAEDGELSRHPIEQGSVDSTVAIHCTVNVEEETQICLWLCLGRTLEEVLDLHETVLQDSTDRIHRNCANYWKSWVNKANNDFGSLDLDIVELYKRSLLTIRMHANNTGGIVAAADSDIMAFNRDTYTYVWPRDGAFVSLALDQAGYREVTRRFFAFCTKVLSKDGYLMHKYNPDTSLGSSWHPWFKDGKPQLPIQEDETALVIHAIWNHFERNQDFECLQDMFERFVKRAAKFLAEFRETESGLPLASYDPWEEQRGVFTYTTACTIAGLAAAAKIANILGHYMHSERYQSAADAMQQAMMFHLYDEEQKCFVKSIARKDGQTVARDTTPDASIAMVWKLGILPVTDPRAISTMERLRRMLAVHTQIGGMARYTNDVYHAVVQPSQDIPGNPWIITTLWDAQWDIACAKELRDLESAREKLNWVKRYASGTGLLAEQLNPLTGAPLSVSPLTWSHATYVETVLQFVEKEKSLQN